MNIEIEFNNTAIDKKFIMTEEELKKHLSRFYNMGIKNIEFVEEK